MRRTSVQSWTKFARVRKIAEELNNRGILAPRGGEWQPTTVVRLLARLRMQAG